MRNSTPLVRVLETRTELSEAALRSAAELGIGVRVTRELPAKVDGGVLLALDALLGRGETALVCGPSGSGKSVLVRTLAGMLTEEGRRVAVASTVRGRDARSCAVFDLVPGPRAERLGILCGAGLGEASMLVKRPCELSDGQRARLSLAIAMGTLRESAPELRGATLIADEFGSTLDRVAAWALAGAMARWARRTGARFIGVTAHDDLLGALHPNVLVAFDHSERARVLRRRGGAA